MKQVFKKTWGQIKMEVEIQFYVHFTFNFHYWTQVFVLDWDNLKLIWKYMPFFVQITTTMWFSVFRRALAQQEPVYRFSFSSNSKHEGADLQPCVMHVTQLACKSSQHVKLLKRQHQVVYLMTSQEDCQKNIAYRDNSLCKCCFFQQCSALLLWGHASHCEKKKES